MICWLVSEFEWFILINKEINSNEYKKSFIPKLGTYLTLLNLKLSQLSQILKCLLRGNDTQDFSL